MRPAEAVRLVGIQRRVDAAVDDVGTARFCRASHFIPAQAVQRVDADADDIAGTDGAEVDLLERFVDDVRIAVLGRCRRRQHVQPARCDDRHAK